MKFDFIFLFCSLLITAESASALDKAHSPEAVFQTQAGWIGIRSGNVTKFIVNPYSGVASKSADIESSCDGPNGTTFFLECTSGTAKVRVWKRLPQWHLITTLPSPAQVTNLVYDRAHQKVLGFPGKRTSEWYVEGGGFKWKLFPGEQTWGKAYGQLLPHDKVLFYAYSTSRFPDDPPYGAYSIIQTDHPDWPIYPGSFQGGLLAEFPSRNQRLFFLLEFGFISTRNNGGGKASWDFPVPSTFSVFNFEDTSRTLLYLSKGGQFIEVKEDATGKLMLRKLKRKDRMRAITFTASSSTGRTLCLSNGKEWCLYSHGRLGVRLVAQGKAPRGIVLKACPAVFD